MSVELKNSTHKAHVQDDTVNPFGLPIEQLDQSSASKSANQRDSKPQADLHHSIPPQKKTDAKAASAQKAQAPAAQNTKQQAQNEEDAFQEKLKQRIADISQTISIKGAWLSAVFHTIGAAADFLGFGSKVQKVADFVALNWTKALFASTCVFTAIQAAMAKRSWEFASRIVEPFFFIVAQLEDMMLARGFTLGLSQLVYANEKKLKDSGLEGKSWVEDAIENFKAFFGIAKEIVFGGIGSNRRFLTGFGPSNIIKKLKEGWKEFNLAKSINKFMAIFKDSDIDGINKRYGEFLDVTGLRKIQDIFRGDEKKDIGHSVALSGYLMMIGGAIGYFFGIKNKESWMYKLGGLLRNIGGAVADITIFAHPDVEMTMSGMFLSVATVIDAVQRFLPRNQRLLNIVNNIASATYNIGVCLYMNRTSRKNKEEEVRYGDEGDKAAAKVKQESKQSAKQAADQVKQKEASAKASS